MRLMATLAFTLRAKVPFTCYLLLLCITYTTNIIQGSGWTAIAYAAVQKEYDIINTLLDKKADITIQSKVGILQWYYF